jgi:uncharacterized lipoprotein (TIGR02269 family)
MLGVMSKPCWRQLYLVLVGTLIACATAPLAELEGTSAEDEGPAVSFEEACAEEDGLLVLCNSDHCGLYRCQEVMEYASVGRIVPTRTGALTLPSAQEAQRYWGSAQDLPQDTRPVLIIPWDHKPPLLPSQLAMLEEAAKERSKPYEKHHIFPRAFREWFARRGINIDEYVILLEVEKHRSIHRGANGGPWNEAWWKFIQKHKEGVTREEIHRYAGQLIYEFQLFGPVMPYWKQPPPLPRGY